MKYSAKKILALLLTCVMVLSLTACGGSKETETEATETTTSGVNTEAVATTDTTKDSAISGNDAPVAAKDTLTVSLTADSGTLDPQFNIGYDCMGLLRCIYEPLFDTTPDGEFVWCLATSIDYLEPTKWQIHLREDVTFANGNKFNADDVVFTIYRACNRPGASSLLSRVLSDEDNLFAVDEYTVEVNFDRYEIGMEIGTWPSIYMFDKESFSEDTVPTETMGSGPYKLTKMVTNSQWVLERRDDYWNTEDMPAIREITANFLSESTQRVNALETGDTDYTNIAFQDLDYVASMEDYEVILHSAGYAKSLYFSNALNSAFYDNVDARKAVAYAIDREGIVSIAYGGNATVSRLPFAMGKDDQQDEWLDQGFYAEGQNVEKAKELAESSGIAALSQTTPLKIVNNGAADSSAVCELIQEDLRAIGINVEIITTDSGSWFTYIFDATMWDMAVDFSMGDTVLAAFNRMDGIGGGMSYSESSGNPWLGSEEFHELLTDAIGNSNEEERIEATTRMLELLDDAMLYVALCDIYDAYAVNKDIRGFDWSRSGNPTFWDLYWTE